MKNIILLITDTYRYDNLFDRAVRPVRTPCLDRFAAERAFEVRGVYNGSFPTIPHRTDVITGRIGWPHHGWQNLEMSSANALPRMLEAEGYATQLICDCPHLFKSGFQHTFTAAFQHRGQEGDKPLLHLNDPIDEVMPQNKTRLAPMFRGHPLVDTHRWINRYYNCEHDTFSARTSMTTARWLEENYKAAPFFLWVDFFDPHEPWDPPEYLVKRYHQEYDGIPMLHPNYGLAGDYTEKELLNLWAHYAAEAELVDRALGRILQKIDDLRLWDDSIVVITSDHGFSIGEHGRCGKSNISCGRDARFWPIYPEVGHVPFLIAGPGIPQGGSSNALAQPFDIMPTIFELAQIKAEAPEAIEGESFAGIVRGEVGSHRDVVMSACFAAPDQEQLPAKVVTPFVVTPEFGYAPVGADGQEELYDLRKDPLAAIDIAADDPGTVRRMRDAFLEYIARFQGTSEVVGFWKRQLKMGPGSNHASSR